MLLSCTNTPSISTSEQRCMPVCALTTSAAWTLAKCKLFHTLLKLWLIYALSSSCPEVLAYAIFFHFRSLSSFAAFPSSRRTRGPYKEPHPLKNADKTTIGTVILVNRVTYASSHSLTNTHFQRYSLSLIAEIIFIGKFK